MPAKRYRREIAVLPLGARPEFDIFAFTLL
jgi:hypothetical protein